MIGRWTRRITEAWSQRQRTSGEPTSGNGASSFHLIWDLPQKPLRAVSVEFEVLIPPSVPRLYFWALQVSFVGGNQMRGGAHTGLQWNPAHPGSTAVNWGGYASQEDGGEQLTGSQSLLPSSRRNANTRNFDWRPGTRYRLEVAPAPHSPDGFHAWRSTITDVDSGEETVIRDLYSRGNRLLAPMVWSEVFARCEHPSVTVRWSGFKAISEDGRVVAPPLMRVNYQSRARGGCDNTTASIDELGVLQTTSTERQVPQGALLPVPGIKTR